MITAYTKQGIRYAYSWCVMACLIYLSLLSQVLSPQLALAQSVEQADLLNEIRLLYPALPPKLLLESAEPNALSILSGTPFSGIAVKKYEGILKFHLERDTPLVRGGKRVEIVLPTVDRQRTWEYRFSTWFPKNWVNDPNSLDSFAQWHAFPDLAQGESWRSPPLAMLTKGNALYLDLRNDARFITPDNTPETEQLSMLSPLVKEKWIDWRVQIRWSQFPPRQKPVPGMLNIWQNNRLVYAYRGLLGYNDVKGSFFKFGLYKWDWNTPKNHKSIVTQRDILFKGLSEKALN
jgi:hypothetical protein